MSFYFLALVLLSGANFIHDACQVPEMRPSSPKADESWRRLSRMARYVWLALVAWGIWEATQGRMPWMVIIGGLLGSFAVRGLILLGGPKNWWPGLSMGMAVTGLIVGGVALIL